MSQTTNTEALDVLNPFIVLRKAARTNNGTLLTQEDISILSGVSAQYIGRQESGLINSPSPTVRQVLEGLDYRSNYFGLSGVVSDGVADIAIVTGAAPGIEIEGINEWWEYWVRAKRWVLHDALAEEDFSDCITMSQVILKVTSSLNRQSTVYEFCKLLALHPYSVQSVLSQKHISGKLPVALFQAGINWGPNSVAA